MWPWGRVEEEREWTAGSTESQTFLKAEFVFFDRVSF